MVRTKTLYGAHRGALPAEASCQNHYAGTSTILVLPARESEVVEMEGRLTLCRFYLPSKICIDRAAERWYSMRHEKSHNRA